jgi:hypothetical protein
VNIPENRVTEWNVSNVRKESERKLKRIAIDVLITKYYDVK